MYVTWSAQFQENNYHVSIESGLIFLSQTPSIVLQIFMQNIKAKHNCQSQRNTMQVFTMWGMCMAFLSWLYWCWHQNIPGERGQYHVCWCAGCSHCNSPELLLPPSLTHSLTHSLALVIHGDMKIVILSGADESGQLYDCWCLDSLYRQVTSSNSSNYICRNKSEYVHGKII